MSKIRPIIPNRLINTAHKCVTIVAYTVPDLRQPSSASSGAVPASEAALSMLVGVIIALTLVGLRVGKGRYSRQCRHRE